MRIGRFAPTIISSILLILSIALCVLTNLDLIPLSSIIFPISIVLVVVFAAITFFIIALYFSDLKVKKFLNNVIQQELEPIRTRRKEWETKTSEVYEILKQGTAEAKKVAEQTLYNVRSAMKINYFD